MIISFVKKYAVIGIAIIIYSLNPNVAYSGTSLLIKKFSIIAFHICSLNKTIEAKY